MIPEGGIFPMKKIVAVIIVVLLIVFLLPTLSVADSYEDIVSVQSSSLTYGLSGKEMNLLDFSYKDVDVTKWQRVWFSFEDQSTTVPSTSYIYLDGVYLGSFESSSKGKSSNIFFDPLLLKSDRSSQIDIITKISSKYKKARLSRRMLLLHGYPSQKEINLYPVKSLCHVHSTYSDGYLKIADLREKALDLGYQVVLMADHYDSFEKLQPGTDYPASFSSVFDAYISECNDFSDRIFRIIPGVELCSIWHQTRRLTDYSHTTAYFWNKKQSDPYLDQYNGKEEIQYELLVYGDRAGCLCGPAHPELLQLGKNMKTAGRFRFDYDDRYMFGFRHFEFFNSANSQQNKLVLNSYLRYADLIGFLSPISGSDFHLPYLPCSSEQLRRETFFWVEEENDFSDESLKKAIMNGRAIATAHGIVIDDMNVIPGRQFLLTSCPKIKFTLHFSDLKNPWKKVKPPFNVVCHLYRDQKEITEAKKTFSKKTSVIEYFFEDKKAPAGMHRYIFYIDDCLITAPIWLDVMR